jgi:hypothetical protein
MRQLMTIISWDGAMPLLVAFTPSLIRALFPRGHLAEVVAAIFLPILLALFRSHVGSKQLRQFNKSDPIRGRQLALAAAITLLLLFEIGVMILHFANDEPGTAWIVTAALFVSYLFMIWIAVRPRRNLNECGPDFLRAAESLGRPQRDSP